jgi:lipopolysaccharide exporter
MLSKIRNIMKNQYLKDIATLATGTFFSQIIVVLFLPILSRIYNPEEFGLYSLFLAVSGSIAIISTLTYDRAIVLPKNSGDANKIALLAIFFCFITALVSLLIMIFFDDFFINYFGGYRFILFLLPLRVMQIGLQQIFDELSIRHKFYTSLSILRGSNSLIVSLVQFISRFVYKLDGLIFGRFIGDSILLIMILVIHLREKTINFKQFSYYHLAKVAKKYMLFPKFYLPQIFFNTISLNTPFILLPYFYSLEVAGLYGMAIRILEQPLRLIATSSQSVYYQKAAEMFAKEEDIYDIFFNTTKGLLQIFIIPAVLIFIFGPQLFKIFLGDNWFESGIIAQILITWLAFGFIKTPTTMTFSILSLQRVQMYGEFLLLLLRIAAIVLGYYFFESYFWSIILFVIPSIAMDIFFIVFIHNYLKNQRWKICQSKL